MSGDTTLTPPKRFLLFGFDTYYPSGGMGDLIDSFDTEEEALAEADRTETVMIWGEPKTRYIHREDTIEIFDIQTGVTIDVR